MPMFVSFKVIPMAARMLALLLILKVVPSEPLKVFGLLEITVATPTLPIQIFVFFKLIEEPVDSGVASNLGNKNRVCRKINKRKFE